MTKEDDREEDGEEFSRSRTNRASQRPEVCNSHEDEVLAYSTGEGEADHLYEDPGIFRGKMYELNAFACYQETNAQVEY